MLAVVMILAKRRRVGVRGVARALEAKLKRKLRAAACSEPWVEAQIRYLPAVDENDGELMWVAEHVRGVFPVRGMVRCRGCEGFYPPNYITSRGYCLDCVSALAPSWWIDQQPSTCSTIDLSRVKSANRRGKPCLRPGMGG